MQRMLLAVVVVSFFSVAFAADCPDLWFGSPLVDGNKCFRVFESPMLNRYNAQKHCEEQASIVGKTGFLTSVRNAFETNFVKSLSIPMTLLSEDVWIGLIDNAGDLSWDDASTPPGYTHWDIGQPDDTYQCVVTKAKTSGLWSTQDCAISRSFICDLYLNRRCESGWDEHLGFCHKLYINQNRTWSESEAFCRSQGANLASVHSAGENSFITGSMKNHAWLGQYTTDDATWFWSDGSPSDYKGWSSGKPERHSTKYCTHVIGSGSNAGRWSNEHCAATLPDFVCRKKALTLRQE